VKGGGIDDDFRLNFANFFLNRCEVDDIQILVSPGHDLVRS
jgi:hypothetical protein